MKWISIQPLTGGAYLGAEEVIGHPAEAILSFKGLRNISEKNGQIMGVGNEHYLETYLTKHNRMPNYYEFNCGMFDKDVSSENDLDIKFENIDLVVAVPVCSGLSMATSTAKKDTRDSKNCNMKFITHFAITQIKPKAYIFENAPTFMSNSGEYLRKWMENLAKENGYSITYFKTDTQLHENCQRRPRTFLTFIKSEFAPKFNFENSNVDILDFFKNMEESSFNNDKLNTSCHNYPMLDFCKKLYGENWRSHLTASNLLVHIMNEGKTDEFLEFAKSYDNYEKIEKYVNHVEYKLSIGKNYYSEDFTIPKGVMPPVQYRSMPNYLHPIEDRTCTVREYLSLMGMPSDFEWYGNSSNICKIGQNVPVKTAKYIVNECVEALNNNREYSDAKVLFVDNIKQTIKKIA